MSLKYLIIAEKPEKVKEKQLIANCFKAMQCKPLGFNLLLLTILIFNI